MHSYWFWIGSFPVRSYSTIFALAFLLGLGVTLYFSKQHGKEGDIAHWWTLGPLCLVAGIIGARFWQVFFFDWGYYEKHLGQIVAVWQGGLSIQGGIVGALVVAIWYLYRHGESFWRFADLAAPGILLGQSIGRDADFMNGSAFGAPTHQGFGIVFPSNSLAYQYYGHQPLWPAVIWEGQADIILFAFLLILMQRKKGWPQGFYFVYYMLAYSIIRFFLEILRGDSPRFALNWDAAQYTSVIEVIIAVGLLIWMFTRKRKEVTPTEE